MNESTSRRRAPLIPTISTFDVEESVEPVEPASAEPEAICLVVITAVEIDTVPPSE